VSLSIAQVARMSGVTARTLRHYDQIGLLVPAFTGSSGRRHYEPDQLNRLQRILLLRELGLGLQPIAQALAAEANDPNDPNDPNGDGAAAATGRQVAALRRHLAWLHRERDRCTRLIGTVSATIDTLERGEQMSPESMFAGFEHNPYEAEARERWGDDVVEASA